MSHESRRSETSDSRAVNFKFWQPKLVTTKRNNVYLESLSGTRTIVA